MVDGIIQLRSEDAILGASRIDVMINVIKLILHVLECDPEETQCELIIKLLLKATTKKEKKEIER